MVSWSSVVEWSMMTVTNGWSSIVDGFADVNCWLWVHIGVNCVFDDWGGDVVGGFDDWSEIFSGGWGQA
jgi:hypothetical protein